MAPKFKVLAIIFEGFNTLDLNGPLDVFTKSGLSEHFSFDIASETDITTSTENLMVKVSISSSHSGREYATLPNTK